MFGNIKERLLNKCVLITGASSGIGEATAKAFAAVTDGQIKLVLTARTESKLLDLKKTLESEYPALKIFVLVMDINDYRTIPEKVQTLPQDFDVDILINNAGLALGRDHTENMNLEDAYSMMNTNVLGLVTLTQVFIPKLKAKNYGSIVNIGSIAGRNAYPGGSIYCASKAAVKFFTRSVRKELVDTKIKVMEIAPGEIKTNFSLVRYKGDEAKVKDVYKDKQPLEATDIAELIIFSVSRNERTVLAETVIVPSYQ